MERAGGRVHVRPAPFLADDIHLVIRLPCWWSAVFNPMNDTCACRQRQALWRQQDLVQRELENARCLWSRCVEKNRCGEAHESGQQHATRCTAAHALRFPHTHATP